MGHFNAGFSAQDFTASLVHQASDDFRFKPATRVENACATGSAAIHQGVKSILAGQAKLVLVVGVEQMSKTPSDEVGRNLLRASYLQEESGVEGGFAGLFGHDRRSIFPETRRSVGCPGSDRGEKSQERCEQPFGSDPQGPRLRLLSQRKRQESVCRWAAQANRLLAGLRRRCRHCLDGYHHGARHASGRCISRTISRAGFFADVETRHLEVRRLRACLAAGSSPL